MTGAVRRMLSLSWFMLQEHVRSLAVVAPLAITVALYWLFFEYPGDRDYFAATGGFTLLLEGVVVVLLLAGQANRAASYPLIGRLPARVELLGALVLSALAVLGAMGGLFSLLVVVQAKVDLRLLEMALVVPRWLGLGLLAVGVGLHVTRLVSRWGSYLVVLLLMALLATTYDQRGLLLHNGLDWLVRLVEALATPITMNLSDPLLPLVAARYFFGLALAATWSAALLILAAWLFQGKDLLWME